MSSVRYVKGLVIVDGMKQIYEPTRPIGRYCCPTPNASPEPHRRDSHQCRDG